MKDYMIKECLDILIFFGYATFSPEGKGYFIKDATD